MESSRTDSDRERFRAALDAYGKGDFAASARILEDLVSRNPVFAEAWHLLGVCHYAQTNLADAESAIRKALTISERADFHANLGLVLLRMNNLGSAADAYQSALRMDPDSADVCNNLANILCTFRRYDEAVELYRQAIKVQPDFAPGHYNLGSCLFRLERREEAEKALRNAIALNGSYADARRKLADLLVDTQRFEEAFELYKSIGAWGWLQFAMRCSVSWDKLASVDASYLQHLNAGDADPTSPWCLIQMPGMTPALEKRAAYDFSVNRLSELKEPPPHPQKKVTPTDRRLRIGYLSSDFYNHATMHLLAGIFETHTRSDFEVFVFSYGPRHEDDCSRRLHAAQLPVVDISDISDRHAAQKIYEHHVDILVDLKGHTGSARLGITALRPAPIIASWLGYPGTLGHERLADYIVGDSIVTPPKDAGFYSERLALMPNCYQPNDSRRPLPNCRSRREAGLPEQGLVFCSFNQPAKFNPGTFDIWGRLLEKVSGSVLWLLEPKTQTARANIQKEFHRRGIPAERIIFAPPVSQTDHMARLRLADLALDTFPCNSHTTGSDALWCGVPLVTLKGGTFASRVAASLLATHGFPELITENDDDYFNLALELATNEKRHAALKARLEQARMASPLFDTVQFTRDLEKLYRAIVENHNMPQEQRPRIVTVG